MRGLWTALAVVTASIAPSAFAQPYSAERELEVVRSLYEAGNFEDALKRAREALTSLNFTDDQRIELNKYAGAAAFTLSQLSTAEEHLLKVLKLNPDYVLDPFAFPPPMVRYFNDLKTKHADMLSLARQQLAIREEQRRREAREREEQQRLEEERRRAVERMSSSVAVRTVERRSYLMNFLPFGAGQYQQGRTRAFVLLAAIEAALATTSIVAYLQLESMRNNNEVEYVIPGVLGSPDGTQVIKTKGIPPELAVEARNWKLAKYISGVGFYLVWAGGVVDALLHHKDEVVIAPQQTPLPSRGAMLRRERGARPFFFPTVGGAGVGVDLSF